MRAFLMPGFLFAVLTCSVALAQDATTTPDASTLVADCTKLLAANRPMPTGADAPTIQIVQPSAPVVYGQTLTITIETTNFDITSAGRHWHLWVNGQLQGMVYQPTAIIDLPPGTYRLCATLGDTNHVDIGIPAVALVTVEAAGSGTPTPTLPVTRQAAQVTNDSGIGTGQIVMIIVGGLVAAVGGWWLGKRMPRAAK
jgi:hypothetical protein